MRHARPCHLATSWSRRQPSPDVADQLRDAGYDAVHVADVELATAVDPDIVDRAEAHGLVIVTVDTDFPMLIALRRATSPSIPLLRGVNELAHDDHAALFIANLPAVATDLESGAIVSLGPTTYASQASHWPEGSHRSAGDPVRWFLSTEPIWSLRYEASVGVDRRGD